MGRQRRHKPPDFFTVVAGSEAEAERCLAELRELGNLGMRSGERRRGNAVRVDRLREAMTIARAIPPTPRDKWRRKRGKPGKAIAARREARAAATLIDICATRGDVLTVNNATRIIEQARRILDRIHGITPEQRQEIEGARNIIDDVWRGQGQEGCLMHSEGAAVAFAVRIIRSAAGTVKHDRDFCERALIVEARGLVH